MSFDEETRKWLERISTGPGAGGRAAAAALEEIERLKANRGPGNIQEVLDVTQHDLRQAEQRIKELEAKGLSCEIACPRCEAIMDVKLMKATPEGDVGALVALSSEAEGE